MEPKTYTYSGISTYNSESLFHTVRATNSSLNIAIRLNAPNTGAKFINIQALMGYDQSGAEIWATYGVTDLSYETETPGTARLVSTATNGISGVFGVRLKNIPIGAELDMTVVEYYPARNVISFGK